MAAASLLKACGYFTKPYNRGRLRKVIGILESPDLCPWRIWENVMKLNAVEIPYHYWIPLCVEN